MHHHTQDGKADVLMKYAPEEARKLKTDGELPESIVINESTGEVRCLRRFWVLRC